MYKNNKQGVNKLINNIVYIYFLFFLLKLNFRFNKKYAYHQLFLADIRSI